MSRVKNILKLLQNNLGLSRSKTSQSRRVSSFTQDWHEIVSNLLAIYREKECTASCQQPDKTFLRVLVNGGRIWGHAWWTRLDVTPLYTSWNKREKKLHSCLQCDSREHLLDHYLHFSSFLFSFTALFSYQTI